METQYILSRDARQAVFQAPCASRSIFSAAVVGAYFGAKHRTATLISVRWFRIKNNMAPSAIACCNCSRPIPCRATSHRRYTSPCCLGSLLLLSGSEDSSECKRLPVDTALCKSGTLNRRYEA
jgi:hypothetical protein